MINFVLCGCAVLPLEAVETPRKVPQEEGRDLGEDKLAFLLKGAKQALTSRTAVRMDGRCRAALVWRRAWRFLLFAHGRGGGSLSFIFFKRPGCKTIISTLNFSPRPKLVINPRIKASYLFQPVSKGLGKDTCSFQSVG